MTDDNGNDHASPLAALQRYVPLAVWTMVILTLLIIPMKIIGYGYLPGDDALRHAAKAVSGKPWPDILVLNGTYQIDQENGWEFVLRQIYLGSHCDTDKLVLFSVAGLFVLVGLSVVPWLKRPEAWLATLVVMVVVSDVVMRFLIGRPFIVTIAAVMAILLAWQRHGPVPPKWQNAIWMTALIGFAIWMHGVWYLWVLPIAAFFFARQFRWCFLLGASWVAGTLLGGALAGHLLGYSEEAMQLALRALGKHFTGGTLVSELRPAGGNIFGLLVLGGVIVLRQLARLPAIPLSRSPVFWLVALGWILGCETGRFWEDWGAPALMVLVAGDLDLLFQARFAADSLQRLFLAGGLAVTVYATTTCDAGDRWTSNLTQQYLTTDNKDLAGWMPEKGGILYSADMTIFYQTFFKNPTGDWRYILGFESTLMRDEDFKVYHSVLWNYGDAKAYAPWVVKMRSPDRLVIRGGRGSPPNIPQLEWNYGVSGIWIGRLPSTNAIPQGAPATIPATMPQSSATNAVNSAK